MTFLMWMLVGWCGTPYPGWWRWPGPGPRPPQPDPWWAIKIASAVGGLAGGWLTQSILGPDGGAVALIATFGGAIAGGGFLGSVTGLIGGRRGVAEG